jgi:hypothetical protein
MPFSEEDTEEILGTLHKLQKTKFLINDYKQHWRATSLDVLFKGLLDEVQELQISLAQRRIANSQLECADIANFAAMICDNIRNTTEWSEKSFADRPDLIQLINNLETSRREELLDLLSIVIQEGKVDRLLDVANREIMCL